MAPSFRWRFDPYGVLGGVSILTRGNRPAHEARVSFIFERNIIVTKSAPFFTGAWSPGRFKFTGNLYWDYANPAPTFPIVKTFAPQQQHEHGALLADPRFEKPEAGNFRLAPDIPAVGAGFRPFRFTAVTSTAQPGVIRLKTRGRAQGLRDFYRLGSVSTARSPGGPQHVDATIPSNSGPS